MELNIHDTDVAIIQTVQVVEPYTGTDSVQETRKNFYADIPHTVSQNVVNKNQEKRMYFLITSTSAELAWKP